MPDVNSQLPDQINQILEFWFSTETDELKIIAKQSGLWWSKDANTDNDIKKQFLTIYQSAVNGDLDEWLNTVKGQLALIILLDQFSRVIRRNTADVFVCDIKALAISLDGINNNNDQELRPIERVFYYMPLEHSEDIEVQNQCVRLFQELLDHVPDFISKEFRNYLQFAIKHREIIERFNRFPHRNKVLNLSSSNEQTEYLANTGSAF